MKHLLFLSILSSLLAEEIAIVDFGSQTTHLIARRLTRMGVDAKIVPPNSDFTSMNDLSGIILSGVPASVYEKNAPSVDPIIYSLNVPILGICYGWQLMAHQLGGRVERTQKEYGIKKIEMGSAIDLP